MKPYQNVWTIIENFFLFFGDQKVNMDLPIILDSIPNEISGFQKIKELEAYIGSGNQILSCQIVVIIVNILLEFDKSVRSEDLRDIQSEDWTSMSDGEGSKSNKTFEIGKI